ncbi:hypothetical protein PIB30_112696, partial [Stylosanthes scabra]|nr:hypothetical protein [Stylosanthes scabra]
MVEQFLGARPPVQENAQKEAFAIRLLWLRDRLQHVPLDADEVTLRQLVGAPQPARDQQEGRLLRWRARLDRVSVEQFRWTPYDSPEMQ